MCPLASVRVIHLAWHVVVLGSGHPPPQQDSSLLQGDSGLGASISYSILGSGLSTLVPASKILLLEDEFLLSEANSLSKPPQEASETTQWVKVLATRLNDLSWAQRRKERTDSKNF